MKTKIRKHSLLFMLIYGILLVVIIGLMSNCTNKPVRFSKQEWNLPAPSYVESPDTLPFRFRLSDQARFSARRTKEGEYFCDVVYPGLNAQLYCTWHSIHPDLFHLMAQESHRLAYQHSAVATAIREKAYSHDSVRVYGILYEIEGNAATPLQIALTDSSTYFFNASLYFDMIPDADSIAPLVDYIRQDVVQLMESFRCP